MNLDLCSPVFYGRGVINLAIYCHIIGFSLFTQMVLIIISNKCIGVPNYVIHFTDVTIISIVQRTPLSPSIHTNGATCVDECMPTKAKCKYILPFISTVLVGRNCEGIAR